MIAVAWADDPLDEPLTFNFDYLLVTTFQPEDEASEADAVRLHDALTEHLSRNNEMISMDDVPEFEVHDYTASTYMTGCPPGQYAGCAMVLGQRADAIWVVGASVRRAQDEFDPEVSYPVLAIHFVDITEAREVASFALPVMGDEETVLAGITRVYDDMVKGVYQLEDLRGDRTADPDAAAQIDDARMEILAQSLSELEEQLGTPVRSGTVGWLEAPKLTREDLAKLAEREQRTPWDRLDMAQAEYMRFANSGKELDTWRRESQGRFGEILIRAAGGGGGGPWHENYAGQVLLDSGLNPAHTVEFLEVVNSGTAGGELELAFGVLPFAELGVVAGVHTGQTVFVRDDDVAGQVAIPTNPTTVSMSTYHFGARVSLAPFPHWQARPTTAVGLMSWKGSAIPAGGEYYSRLEAPNTVLLQLLPGAEVSANRNLVLFARGGLELPLGGTLLREIEDTSGCDPNITTTGTGAGARPPCMSVVPVPTGERGAGWLVQVGLQIRLGPLFRVGNTSASGATPGIQFEDEDL